MTIEPDGSTAVKERADADGLESSKKRRQSGTASDPSTTTTSCLVNAGLRLPVRISTSIPPHTRVTLQFPTATPPSDLSAPLVAEPVSPDVPRVKAGYYWGYQVRTCASLSAVFTECSFANGYDLSIGTSERGVPLDSTLPGPSIGSESGSDLVSVDVVPAAPASQEQTKLPHAFTHLLVVIGGVSGLEAAVTADSDLTSKGIGAANIADLFDFWVNLLPGQGSRTIRTEEAVWCALMGLRNYIVNRGLR